MTHAGPYPGERISSIVISIGVSYERSSASDLLGSLVTLRDGRLCGQVVQVSDAVHVASCRCGDVTLSRVRGDHYVAQDRTIRAPEIAKLSHGAQPCATTAWILATFLGG